MVPDIGLFFPVVDYTQTHSPAGVFVVCMPLGVALFILFEMVMRRPLLALLPIWVQRRIASDPQIAVVPRLAPQLAFYLTVALAIVMGAFSHQIWDAFTHQGRWGTKLVPALNSLVSVFGYEIPGYKIFQYGSTFVGLPILIAVFVFWLRKATPGDNRDSMASKHKLAAALVVCSIPILVGIMAIFTQPSAYQALGATIKQSGAIILSLSFAYCGMFYVFKNRHHDA